MGEIVQAQKMFKKHAQGLNDKDVCLVMNTYDHVYLKVKRRSAGKATETIAVPLDKYPDVYFKEGDVVRFKLSSKIISPGDKQKPCAVVSQIEILKGEIKILPAVQVEYHSGHKYARVTI